MYLWKLIWGLFKLKAIRFQVNLSYNSYLDKIDVVDFSGAFSVKGC